MPTKSGGERGIRTPSSASNLQDNLDERTKKRTEISVAACPDLSQVVTAWAKLPAPLKAAILAIVGSVDSSSEVKP
jgi:hypothetical protein